MALRDNLREFPNISHHAFQHPADSQALAALRNVPALPTAIKYLSEKSLEQHAHLEHISCALRVNAQQYPSLYRQFVRMAQVLDVRKLPSLYIETTPTINAYAMGMENYSIVICSGLIDIMEEDELLAILGHELGHVKCEHQLYKTMAHLLTTFGSALLSQIPYLGSAISAGLQLALLEWNRKAEFSCDRAALLATQNVDSVGRALAKLAGFSHKLGGEMNIDAVEKQAEEYHEIGTKSLLMNVVKLNSLLSQTHPYPVVRVKEIRRWAASSEYENIISGNYRKMESVNQLTGWNNVDIGTLRTKICSKCKYPCDEDYVFCPNCQGNIRDVLLSCSNCKFTVENDWARCINCGKHLLRQPAGLLNEPPAH